MIKYVLFKSAITVGGNDHAIESWVREKHAERIELIERGNWIFLQVKGGDRYRVPMSNVGYIRDDGVDEQKDGKR